MLSNVNSGSFQLQRQRKKRGCGAVALFQRRQRRVSLIVRSWNLLVLLQLLLLNETFFSQRLRWLPLRWRWWRLPDLFAVAADANDDINYATLMGILPPSQSTLVHTTQPYSYHHHHRDQLQHQHGHHLHQLSGNEEAKQE